MVRGAPQLRRYGIERREFLRYLAAVSAIPSLPNLVTGQVVERPTFAANPFTLGVASGDPEPNGVVLWTRLAPRPLEPFGGMPAEAVLVRWEVAADEAFTDIVRSGATPAVPQLGQT